MPSSVGPNTFGEENLVFGYDLGDVINSYKGEPVTNLQTVGEGNVYTSVTTVNTTAELVDMVTPFGNKAWKITIPANGTNGYSNTRAQGPTIQINRDGTYYYHGAWVWMSDDDYVLWEQGNTYVYKYSTGSNGMSSWSLRSALNRKDRAGRIWKAWGAWTARTEGGTGNQYHTFYKNGTLTRDLVFYIVAPMWGVGKARPVFFANGTRSATQGLIDLTGTSTIDLTNVSFDSNAQMTFDGTNDYVDLGNSSQFNITNAVSIFTWVKISNTSGWDGIFGTFNGGGFIHFQLYLGGLNCYVYGPNAGYDRIDASQCYITSGQWAEVGMTFGNNTLTMYLNGIAMPTTVVGSSNSISSNSQISIGRVFSADRYMGGDIKQVKIYNRALTASEVASNYKAIKGRFNI